jgi:hypothetical protein
MHQSHAHAQPPKTRTHQHPRPTTPPKYTQERTYYNDDKSSFIDILAITESWEHIDNSSDYTPISKYQWYGKPNVKTSRETGFLISKKLSNRTSIKQVKNEDPNIIWIQFITNKHTYNFASVYVPYAERSKASEICTTLIQKRTRAQSIRHTHHNGRPQCQIIRNRRHGQS